MRYHALCRPVQYGNHGFLHAGKIRTCVQCKYPFNHGTPYVTFLAELLTSSVIELSSRLRGKKKLPCLGKLCEVREGEDELCGGAWNL